MSSIIFHHTTTRNILTVLLSALVIALALGFIYVERENLVGKADEDTQEYITEEPVLTGFTGPYDNARVAALILLIRNKDFSCNNRWREDSIPVQSYVEKSLAGHRIDEIPEIGPYKIRPVETSPLERPVFAFNKISKTQERTLGESPNFKELGLFVTEVNIQDVLLNANPATLFQAENGEGALEPPKFGIKAVSLTLGPDNRTPEDLLLCKVLICKTPKTNFRLFNPDSAMATTASPCAVPVETTN